MLGLAGRPLNSELRQLVAEASLALAQLDADRLEELAISCQALNRGTVPQPSNDANRELVRQAREASAEMAIFGRVLEATRTNLEVMKRIRDRRNGRMEYGQAPRGHSFGCEPWTPAENHDGNH
jgi:hypothetical protein